jgi:hypothetical protein
MWKLDCKGKIQRRDSSRIVTHPVVRRGLYGAGYTSPEREQLRRHADHGPEHVGSAGQMAEHPGGVIHLGSRLEGHLFVWEVGHQAFRIPETEVPGVEQGGEHGVHLPFRDHRQNTKLSDSLR